MPKHAPIAGDVYAGITVALIAIPQCMAFATIAGLPPVAGIYAAVVMGLAGSLLTGSPKAIFGPAITTSSMTYAVLAAVAPNDATSWPGVAALLAVCVGAMTLAAWAMRVGEMVRFVPRSVLNGLTVGVALLILASQLAPLLGVPSAGDASFVDATIATARNLGQVSWHALLMGGCTVVAICLFGLLGPRVPAAFLAIAAGAAAVWALERLGIPTQLESIGALPRRTPDWVRPAYDGPFLTELAVGAASVTLVGIIQTLAMTKAYALRDHELLNPRRELAALGVSNLATGVLSGFPGALSVSRTAANDAVGARTRFAGLITTAATVAIVAAGGPLAHYITRPAIAGLLLVTAWSVLDRPVLREILVRGGDDRLVLIVTVGCIAVIPIHWAILIGLALSILMFLRRVSQVHICEMVAGPRDHFLEHAIDEQTGRSAVAMLQIEGPLFFAQADDVAATLNAVFSRRPRVTIIRMRRTRQVDFSVVAAMNHAAERYLADGGRLILCGLTPDMHKELSAGVLGKTVGAQWMIPTTKQVFGSAHQAIATAREIVGAGDERPLFRADETDDRAETVGSQAAGTT